MRSAAVAVAVLVNGSQAFWRAVIKQLTTWEFHETWSSHRYGCSGDLLFGDCPCVIDCVLCAVLYVLPAMWSALQRFGPNALAHGMHACLVFSGCMIVQSVGLWQAADHEAGQHYHSVHCAAVRAWLATIPSALFDICSPGALGLFSDASMQRWAGVC